MSKGTYIGLRPIESSIEKLHSLISSTPIKNPIAKDRFHITLLHAPKHKIVHTPDPDLLHNCLITDVEIMGEGKWQALVLKLQCASLHERFQSITKEHGNIHSYPTLTIHVSLKYSPEVTDLELIREAYTVGEELLFSNEYVKELR